MLDNTYFYVDESEALEAAIAEFERDVRDVTGHKWTGQFLIARLQDDIADGHDPQLALKCAYAELGAIIDQRMQ